MQEARSIRSACYLLRDSLKISPHYLPEILASEAESYPGETEADTSYSLQTPRDTAFLWLMSTRTGPQPSLPAPGQH